MFVSPSKIIKNRILKDRTLTFETVNKNMGNIVIIPTVDKDALVNTIKGKLFKPTQLLCYYTPRVVKPKNRTVVKLSQKDLYAEIKEKTAGRIKKCRVGMSAYGGQNLIYDIFEEYNINKDILQTIRKNRNLQFELYKLLENSFFNISNDSDYENTYIVFPMSKPYDDPQKTLVNCANISTTDPLSIFLIGVDKGIIDKNKYKNIKGIFFYVPGKEVIVSMDLFSENFDKEWPSIKQKIRRLNSLNSGEETVDDIVEELEQPNETIEDKREQIKELVFSNLSKKMKTNLNDFDVASQNEKDIIVLIDDKIEKYLGVKNNLNKSVNDMITELEADQDFQTKVIKYIETKKAATIKLDTLSKGLEKETEITSTLQDMDELNKIIEPKKYKIDDSFIDSRVEQTHLAALDEEYNKKQIMTDLSNCIAAFGNTSFYPMAVDNIEIDDISDFSDEKYNYSVRYKTNEGKTLSFQIEVPKIVDSRYLFIGGNKKVIKKQIVRLPIVKTQGDRVELTTNYAKMTIERTSGNLSRKNAYLFKKLKDIKNSQNVVIEYGDNSVVNSRYINNFEYEEFAGKVNSITTNKFELIFNRDNIKEDIEILNPNISEEFFDDDRTPIGFTKVGEYKKDIVYIRDNKIFSVDIITGISNGIKDSFFEFICDDVLHLDMSILPSIGKSFMYSKVKFLATTYPMFAVVGSQNGLTDILKRYVGEGNYFKSQKPTKTVDYVSIKFKDCYLNYKDEMKNTLLLNAIYLMNTEEFNYAEFDSDVPYTQYFMRLLGDSVGMHTRNTLRINLDVFVDPISRDILRDLKQPTNVIDILLYANTLLVGNKYKPLNDMSNYRIRSNELIADLLYYTIADAYVKYEKHRINGRPININIPKNALIKRLLEQPNVNDKSVLNPVLEVEQIAQASAKGWRGVNINDAYTLEMRAYDDSMIGYISGNSTPYSGQAGITRALTYDPQISSVRGYIPYIDKNSVSATNILSPTELLAPFTAAGADAPRQA